MQLVANEEMLRHYLRTAVEIDEDKPVLVDKYISEKNLKLTLFATERTFLFRELWSLSNEQVSIPATA